MKFQFNASKITHFLASALSVLVIFVVSPAGQAVIKQYPALSGIAGVALTIAAVYHIPTTK